MKLTHKALLLTLLAATPVLAQSASNQSASNRILKIEATPASGSNLRTGPLNFTGNVTATVSTLKIQSAQATMTGPSGVPIMQAEAQGKRSATFTGNVSVNRGRLSAKGDKLAYSEVTGQGVLTGNASATFVPEKKDDGDPVNIKATQMSLDVDTNVSTSTGGVQLVSGNQTGRADKLVFDEDKELAQFTGNPTLTRAAKGSQKELVMSGQEVRALTKTKTLYVTGGVKLVQGTTTTTGNSLYYDDKKNVAYIMGNAVSIDSKNKVTLRGNVLEQRTDLVRVREVTSFKVPTEQFKLRGEK